MNKFFALVAIVISIFIFADCSSSKKTMAMAVPKLNYETNLQTIIGTNCTPCHIPAKGGNKKPYDNFINVKTDIDEIIRRIELAPSEKGFMPLKHEKLNDSTITVFKQWRADGLLEK